jgi:NADPH:quinone reductase-like Zn-dependent oxidoreductase
MKAVVYTRYGPPDVLRLADVDKPAPGDGEVLVKVRAVSLNASDWEVLIGKPLYSRIGGPFRPGHATLGSDIAGRIEAVGPNVTRFEPGDDVFADNLSGMGGFAEYARIPEKLLARIPEGMDHAEAACLPQAGAIALQGIRDKGQVRAGQRVLVNGAGGGSGTYAIQLAKLDGAEVTGVDNAEKLEYLRSVGADHVIDYRSEDFTAGGRTYDLILDVAGYRSPRAYRRALNRGGRYLFVGGSMAPLIELIRAGKVTTVIDRRYPLAEVSDALRYLGGGHAKGKVVIAVD